MRPVGRGQAVALVATLAALWIAGARTAARADADDTSRLRAAAAALLVAPFILFGLVPGVGPPREQPVQDNELRFLLLAIDPMLVGAGLLLLKEALAGAGDRLHASLGLAAIGVATPLDAFAMAVLFFGGALTYIATAAFAGGLARVGWLGRGAATGLQILCGVCLAFLIARGFAYPSLHAAFSHWYTVPGFIAGIPAVLRAPTRRAAPSMPT